MDKKPLTGQKVLDEVMKCGITHIVWLPDAETRFMYEAMNNKPALTLVPVCREGEAIPIAARSHYRRQEGDGIAPEYRLFRVRGFGSRSGIRLSPSTDVKCFIVEMYEKAFR